MVPVQADVSLPDNLTEDLFSERALCLEEWYPRIYLPEEDLGRVYGVVPVSNIICPAPVMPDISLVHVAELEHVQEEGLRGKARKERLQGNPKFRPPLIPKHWLCPREKCNSFACLQLHKQQYPGADLKRTHIYVLNLLLVAMSRGTWDS